MKTKTNPIGIEEIRQCISTLKALSENSTPLAQLSEEESIELLKAAGLISRPSKDEIKKRQKDLKQNKKQTESLKNRSAKNETGIRQARLEKFFTAPAMLTPHPENTQLPTAELTTPRDCYICKAKYTRLHFFYDSMCPECAEFNYQKRFQSADLSGQIALITGARVKIGYQAALKMLKAGATVIVTTRFPIDAARRYAAEEDFHIWKERLHIYGLDLRHIPSVEIFTSYIEQTFDRLDLLINNAAQTVRRPPGYYAHLQEEEAKPYHLQSASVQTLIQRFTQLKQQLHAIQSPANTADPTLPVTLSWHAKIPAMGLAASAQLSQIPYHLEDESTDVELFPVNQLDADLQQIDLRKTNSWRLRLGEIQTPEMIEVQLINAIAPFVLCNRLIPIMKRDYTGCKHIVNVSAMEGKFFRFKQLSRHPHTNMAKAALNMMTHTAAADLAKEGIFINAVDTGWVTDEDPVDLANFKQQVHDFQPPLDIVDGAARVCDPFFYGILTGIHWQGKFLKDYKPTDW
jgi:NAD(P)-dependent dehydrogenase (short-subunit alcohol dehydrogenase family)